jgi:hypothetical protein
VWEALGAGSKKLSASKVLPNGCSQWFMGPSAQSSPLRRGRRLGAAEEENQAARRDERPEGPERSEKEELAESRGDRHWRSRACSR